jgi:hypothetical protein
MRGGRVVLDEPLAALRARAAAELAALPAQRSYPVRISPGLTRLSSSLTTLDSARRITERREVTR